MLTYEVTVTGQTSGESVDRDLIFFIAATSDEDALIKAGSLQRVRLLDSVSSITTTVLS